MENITLNLCHRVIAQNKFDQYYLFITKKVVKEIICKYLLTQNVKRLSMYTTEG